MSLIPGITEVKVLSVAVVDLAGDKPTICNVSYKFNGESCNGTFNIGDGFIDDLNRSVVGKVKNIDYVKRAQDVVDAKCK